MQKRYQQLRKKENLQAVESIYKELKKSKCISKETFDQIYMKCNGIRYKGGCFDHLIETTHQFLYDHDLMTRKTINGLVVYVATQKCFRTKNFKNATRETQVVSNAAIDAAIKYVELNNEMVPFEFEGKVVANILGLEGSTKKHFINSYPEFVPTGVYNLPIKYNVISVVTYFERSGLIKKI